MVNTHFDRDIPALIGLAQKLNVCNVTEKEPVHVSMQNMLDAKGRKFKIQIIKNREMLSAFMMSLMEPVRATEGKHFFFLRKHKHRARG